MYLLGVQWNMDFIQRWFFMFQKIAKECLAGFTVAIVALPLAIAFGIAATGTSEGALVGLYGAIFAGLFALIWRDTWASNITTDQLPLLQQELLRRTG